MDIEVQKEPQIQVTESFDESDIEIQQSQTQVKIQRFFQECTGLPYSLGQPGNTILNCVGVPAPSFGSNGDFCIGNAGTVIYGPKLGGIWGSGISLIGPPGVSGGGSIVWTDLLVTAAGTTILTPTGPNAVSCDPSLGSQLIILANSTLMQGKSVYIRRTIPEDDNTNYTVTVQGEGGQLIDGESSIVMYGVESVLLLPLLGNWGSL